MYRPLFKLRVALVNFCLNGNRKAYSYSRVSTVRLVHKRINRLSFTLVFYFVPISFSIFIPSSKFRLFQNQFQFIVELYYNRSLSLHPKIFAYTGKLFLFQLHPLPHSTRFLSSSLVIRKYDAIRYDPRAARMLVVR